MVSELYPIVLPGTSTSSFEEVKSFVHNQIESNQEDMWDSADIENNSMFIRARTQLVVAPSQKGGTAGLGSLPCRYRAVF